MTQELILNKVNELIQLADNTLLSSSSFNGDQADYGLYTNFRTSSLSFLLKTYQINHPYYNEFNKNCCNSYKSSINSGKAILEAVKNEIETGWYNSLKGIISAEIFSDFLDMAEYLLNEGYKDASAVMIGSVLEGHLRQLCTKNGLGITEIKNDKPVSKKTETMNHELAGSEIYNKLDQKNVTAWLDLRNKAAHGKYDEYKIEQVRLMYSGVLDFMTRIPV
jgi:hypothetical protein